MTLEEECNWILSGREPIPVGPGQDNGADSDGDDDTLDDISGDEVGLELETTVVRAVEGPLVHRHITTSSSLIIKLLSLDADSS